MTAKDPNVVQELAGILKEVNAKNLRESYHDALQYKEELFTLFNLGHLSLEDRSKGEILFWQICERIHRDLKTLKEIPEEFEDMETMLADKYVLNFSVFQSLPDSWAIDQLFPILPIHRLNEKPTEFATLADITCDSDGKIERFIDLRDIDETLPLRSCLLLGEGGGEDGYLRASEIYRMALHADVVVLSACETGWMRTGVPRSRTFCRARRASACSST